MQLCFTINFHHESFEFEILAYFLEKGYKNGTANL